MVVAEFGSKNMHHLKSIYAFLLLAMTIAVLGLRIKKNDGPNESANSSASFEYLNPQALSVAYSAHGIAESVDGPEHLKLNGFDSQIDEDDDFDGIQVSSTELVATEKDTLANFSLRVSNFTIATVIKIALFFMEFVCSPNSLVCIGIAAYVKPMFDNEMASVLETARTFLSPEAMKYIDQFIQAALDGFPGPK